MVHLTRWRLITKEMMESYCKGEIVFGPTDSVNDDLESLFEDLKLGNEPDEQGSTYFLPKLTGAELKLVERKDPKYLDTFGYTYPDVPEADIKLSESNSKYIEGKGGRGTFTIEHQFSKSKFKRSSQVKFDNFGTNRKRKHSSTEKRSEI